MPESDSEGSKTYESMLISGELAYSIKRYIEKYKIMALIATILKNGGHFEFLRG